MNLLKIKTNFNLNNNNNLNNLAKIFLIKNLQKLAIINQNQVNKNQKNLLIIKFMN